MLAMWTKPNNIALATIAGILLHLILRYLLNSPQIAWEVPLIVVLIIGGVPLVVSLTQKLFAREFGSDHLAGISFRTSVILGEYLVAAIVILMLSGGTALEQFASRRASSVLDALAKRMPQIAHRKIYERRDPAGYRKSRALLQTSTLAGDSRSRPES